MYEVWYRYQFDAWPGIDGGITPSIINRNWWCTDGVCCGIIIGSRLRLGRMVVSRQNQCTVSKMYNMYVQVRYKCYCAGVGFWWGGYVVAFRS